MSVSERPACELCKDMAVPIKGGGSQALHEPLPANIPRTPR